MENEEIMMYVPILKTLDVILQNETIFAEVKDVSLVCQTKFLYMYVSLFHLYVRNVCVY